MSDSIRVLKGPERVRLRPAVIFGDDGIDGSKHAIGMMLCIMASECIDGYSPSLEVTVFNDLSIGVKNFGRGIFLGDPQSKDDSQWQDMFCELLARSRYADPKSSNTRYSIFAEPDTTPKREYSIEDYDDLYLCAVQYKSHTAEIDAHIKRRQRQHIFRRTHPSKHRLRKYHANHGQHHTTYQRRGQCSMNGAVHRLLIPAANGMGHTNARAH